MQDRDCVEFLRWALPRLHLRWQGFRRVRRQVCRRLTRRLRELSLEDLEAYRAHLARNEAEWEVLDGLCRISISRFHRDRAIWDALRDEVLPTLARAAQAKGRPAGIVSSRDLFAFVAGGLERVVDEALYEEALTAGVDPYDHPGGSYGR